MCGIFDVFAPIRLDAQDEVATSLMTAVAKLQAGVQSVREALQCRKVMEESMMEAAHPVPAVAAASACGEADADADLAELFSPSRSGDGAGAIPAQSGDPEDVVRK